MQHERQTYDRVTMALHWTIGIGIILLAGVELVRHEFPKGSFIREVLKPIHQPAGTALFALILVRIMWRLSFARVPSAAHASGIMGAMARLMHLALYAMMVALPLLGMLYVFGSDKSIDFGVVQLAFPLKAALGSLAKSFREVHETLGIAILVVAGLHAVAALFHHYVLKDDTMVRMTGGSKSAEAWARPVGANPSGAGIVGRHEIQLP